MKGGGPALACSLLTITIITMILVSVHPFEPRKIFLLIAGLVCFIVFPCLAEPVMVSVPATPYDRQMTRIQPVLTSKPQASKDTLSLAVVNTWIQSLA